MAVHMGERAAGHTMTQAVRPSGTGSCRRSNPTEYLVCASGECAGRGSRTAPSTYCTTRVLSEPKQQEPQEILVFGPSVLARQLHHHRTHLLDLDAGKRRSSIQQLVRQLIRQRNGRQYVTQPVLLAGRDVGRLHCL